MIYQNKLNNAGIADTRCFKAALAISSLHEAVAMMDKANREKFFDYVEQVGGLRALLNDFGTVETMNNEL